DRRFRRDLRSRRECRASARRARHARAARRRARAVDRFRRGRRLLRGGCVSDEAEAMNHHPEWTNQYGRVALRLSTHDAGGKVTLKDCALAQKIQALSWVG
ncbi:MAG: 4a-hydroxytetrahydrobiopterin dehydratase, partial [Opitutaceae bacterium]